MGFAAERLGSMMREEIFKNLVGETRTQGSRIWSDCPYGHEESKNKSASCYKAEGDQWKCYSCGEYGDLITVYAVVNGMEPGSADAFRAFASEYVPGWSSDSATPVKRKAAPKPQPKWHGAPADMPPALWSEKAGEFVESCMAALPDSTTTKIHLSDHGIDLATAQKFGLGWNDHDRYYKVTSWGLPYEDGNNGERKIWLPKGLVLPTYFKGHVAKLKIRRDGYKTGHQAFQNRKYWEGYGGSKTIYVVLGDPEKVIVWVLVETERDAFTLMKAMDSFPWADFIGVMANCGTGKRPDAETEKYLRKAMLILNALDSDKAGRVVSHEFWSKEFANSIRWPVPSKYGKDVGDAVMPMRFERLRSAYSPDQFYWLIMDSLYLDLAAWIQVGLPQHVRKELDYLADAAKAEAEPVAPVAVEPKRKQEATPPPQKTYFELVLDRLEPSPLWRQELITFQEVVKENGFRVYRKKADGKLRLGVADGNWKKLNSNEKRRTLFAELRRRFHEACRKDERLGLNSLENIIDHYFNKQLEVR
ncbi:MAG: hypothetical protein ACNI27_12810 [Desulfovibrio sp.]